MHNAVDNLIIALIGNLVGLRGALNQYLENEKQGESAEYLVERLQVTGENFDRLTQALHDCVSKDIEKEETVVAAVRRENGFELTGTKP